MARGKRRAPRHVRHRWLLALVGAVAIIAAGGVAWAVLDPRLGALAADDPVGTETPTPVASAAARTPEADDAGARACRTAHARGVAAISAARKSVVHDWAAHIQAMSDQMAGKISETDEKAIWTTTRTRGPSRVAAFDSAYAEYQKARKACQAVDPATLNAEQRAAVADCQTIGAEVDSTLAAAQKSIDEWRAHLNAMAARRAGTLDPDTAMNKWMAAYQMAPMNIGKFERAEESYDKATATCDAT